jgi:hypothetical protein
VRNTDICSMLANRGNEIFQVRAATLVIDVDAIWFGVNCYDVGSGAAVDLGRNVACCAVRAVDHNADAVERRVQRRQEVIGIDLNRVRVRHNPANLSTQRSIPWFPEPGFDEFLDGIIELHTTAGEELDPVIGHWVVRCREHHADIGLQGIGQVSDRGSWHDPNDGDVNTSTRQTGNNSGFEEFPTCTSVTTNNGGRPMSGEGTDIPQNVGGGHREVDSKFCGQIAVGQPSNTIGAEQPAQSG